MKYDDENEPVWNRSQINPKPFHVSFGQGSAPGYQTKYEDFHPLSKGDSQEEVEESVSFISVSHCRDRHVSLCITIMANVKK